MRPPFEKLSSAVSWALGLTLIAGVALNFGNVCLRYFFGAPFAWTEETMTFIVMVSIVLATARDENLKIDILTQIVPGAVGLVTVRTSSIYRAISVGVAARGLRRRPYSREIGHDPWLRDKLVP